MAAVDDPTLGLSPQPSPRGAAASFVPHPGAAAGAPPGASDSTQIRDWVREQLATLTTTTNTQIDDLKAAVSRQMESVVLNIGDEVQKFVRNQLAEQSGTVESILGRVRDQTGQEVQGFVDQALAPAIREFENVCLLLFSIVSYAWAPAIRVFESV